MNWPERILIIICTAMIVFFGSMAFMEIQLKPLIARITAIEQAHRLPKLTKSEKLINEWSEGSELDDRYKRRGE